MVDDKNVKPITSANDSWHAAVKLFTGYDAPPRDGLFKTLEGNEGIPQMKVEISRQGSVTYVDVDDLNWMQENAGWRIENTDFVIPFYATSGDTASSGDTVSMYKARFTLLGNKSNDGPPAGGVVEGGEFKSQYDDHLGLSGDKATWNTEGLTQYSYGTGRALEALLYEDHGTHGFAWNGKDVDNAQAVSLASFDTAADSFDRVAQFFVDRSAAVEEWQTRLGTEQNEAWRGQAAGVFWNLVDTLAKQYAGYAKDMRPAGTVGSLQGDEIRQAKTDFRNAVVELHSRWMDWELYMGNPLRWLHDLLKEIADHVWHNNIKQITYKVNSTSTGMSTSYYTTYHATGSFNQDATRLGKSDGFGKLTELSTWKAVGERAVQNWQASVIENLVEPADVAIGKVHDSWSATNFDLGSIRTRGGGDLSSSYAEDQAAKDKAEAEAAAAEAERKQEEFIQWQKDQAAAAAAAAAAAKAEQEAKEKAAKAEQDAKEKAAKAEQEAKEKAAAEEQARRDKEAEEKQAAAEAKQAAKEAEQEAKQEEKEKEQEAKQAEQEAKQEAKEAEQKAEQERLQAEQEAKQAEQEQKQEEAQARQEQMQIMQMNQARTEQERARKEQEEQQAEAEAKQAAKEAEQEAKQAEQEAKQEAKQAEQEAKQEEKEKEQEAKQAEQEAKQAEKEKEAEAAQEAARQEAEQQQAEQEQRQLDQEKEREQAQAQAQAAYDEQRQQVLGGGSLNGGSLGGDSAARDALSRISADSGVIGEGSLNGGSLNGGSTDGSLGDLLGGDDLGSPTSISGPVYQGDGLPGPDGGVTHMDSEGRVVTDYPDGSSTVIDPDTHSATVTRPDGTSMTGPLNTGDTLPNPDGSLSHLDSEGRLVTEFPDGSTSVLDPDTGATTYTRPDGTTDSGYLNGGTGSSPYGGDASPYGSGSSYEEELYDELPYASPFDRASAASADAGASAPMVGTPLNTGSLPGSSVGGSAQSAGTPMGGMPMGGMPMGGGQGGGQGGQGTSERIRNVIDGGQVVSNRRSRGGTGVTAAGRAPDEAPIALPRNATTTSGMPMVPPAGGGAPARPQTESGDRARDAWVQEEEDVWGTDEGGAPAVIGR